MAKIGEERITDPTEPISASRYWKISPGTQAWNWAACRDGNFIAMGCDELGDVSTMRKAQFDARLATLAKQDPDGGWNQWGAGQIWRFAHEIQEGDRIVVNRGTSEVLGIGTVVGPYEFVPGVRHGHRLPVEWDDLTPRQVDEGGWIRALIEIDQEKFQAILEAPALTENETGRNLSVLKESADSQRNDSPISGNDYFSAQTFTLLEELHAEPYREFYLEHKEAFKTHLEEPFQRLMLDVIEQLPRAITSVMETEKRLFARILKNDFGQGGAWDFYWGALYPKGSKRIADAQLTMWINRDWLEFGFYIGAYGSEQREQFLRNSQKHHATLVRFLKHDISDSRLVFGRQDDITIGADGSVSSQVDIPWQDWLRDPAQADFDVSVVLPRDEVLRYPAEQLRNLIAQTYQRLFPLVLLTLHDDPIPAIGSYLGLDDEEDAPINNAYPLPACAAATGFDQGDLPRALGARH